MEDLKQYTPIELLKMVNDLKLKHDNLKNNVIEDTNQVDILDQKINQALSLLIEIEQEYIEIIEEINNR
jgi:hypothetical protein